MSKNVKIYTTPACPYCIRTKKFLEESKIPFENIDVSANRDKAQEMVDKSGQMGVPVLDIEGKIITGFDKEAILKALEP